ncbi:hypothetical protein ACYZX9_13375 [Sphingomonas citri]|jgi:hypothetical protein|uniref:Uncharacterized protein n=1 Tax=Sphingomonas citri TaxID=2862499 RepID=A0ABS7BUR3_9SPHN|nr:hypothetical protein [Sphingomonas citri]MBW6533340.1 hypothetical protein [Sphingomonas citri]
MGLAAWLGLGRAHRMMRSVDEAIEAVGVALPRFAAFDAVIAEDGRAALVIDTTGVIALVLVRGARVRARVIEWAMVRQTYAGILVETGDRGFGDVLLAGVSAIDVRRLGMPPLPQREPATIVGTLETA